MSYCRWSSDDFGCDLYCYESDEGYVTHVAGRRVLGQVPHVDTSLLEAGDFGAFVAQHMAQRRFMETCERVPIGGPCDGQAFVDRTLSEFRDRLCQLRDMGYRFPQGVLDGVEAYLKVTT